MSVDILDPIDYYKIGKTLKLKLDFINRLYEANQRAYDLSYKESNEIEILDKELYNKNDFELIEDNKRLHSKLRRIRYNCFTNNGKQIINDNDYLTLDSLIQMTDYEIDSCIMESIKNE